MGLGQPVDAGLGWGLNGADGYLTGILAAYFLTPMVGFAVFAGVSVLWLIPDRRMEHAMASKRQEEGHSH